MKGVILAGGTGTRLAPLTHLFNKHLLPVGRYPMIVHPFMQMVNSGVQDVLVVTSPDTVGFLARLIGDGHRQGVQVSYRVQEHPGGIAHGLALARDFVGEHPCLVILGDNILTDNLKPYVESFRAAPQGAHIFVKAVDDPTRYGVAEVRGNQVTRIVEKPKQPKSNYAVTGIYLYDERVFAVIDRLSPSGRGEYEITDVNNDYIGRHAMSHTVLTGDWVDAGTFSSMQVANQLMQDCTYPEFA
ncbi:sugar phosphate nucleotidyltransferase [Alicyclobacillus sp. ALC3]|uniref:sugar phosphate nucleotidyltransferase n=1 Tax=Alicyclobacillus sp. ALC3 TaxID=2796143 RepID=UPI0023795224|nr:sugar phosphate nucleotidyltransferase [Alicyclobacillus sp. ALC3]WDL95162.1 NTP transferase domain-containing protein [Alicyclobacillus sp. ALC3]